LKKHTKWCRLSPNSPYSLSSQFLPHLETQRPFHRRVNFQHIMRQLSLLYNARLDSELSKDDKTSLEYLVGDNLDHTLQSSVTYWVHADNQVETQLFLLKHLVLQLDSSPVSCKEIHRSTRTAYFDSKDWRVYSSLLPESQTSHTVKPKAPQILWEEKSRNKDVLIVIPEGNDHKSLPLKRKNLSTFLSSKRDELDLTSPEWGSNTKDWIQTAEDVHGYIQSSSLHPGTAFPLRLC
jgi:SPX domain protein involved in polyphosphate accumulation